VKTFLDILTDPEKLDNEFSNMLRYAAEQQKEKFRSIPGLNEVIGNSHDEEKWQKRHLKRYIREVTESNQNQSSESFFLNIVPGLKDKIDGEGIGQNAHHKWNLLGHTHELLKSAVNLINGDYKDELLSKENLENIQIVGFFHDLGKNTSLRHYHAEALGKNALMDSFWYLKNFLDTVDKNSGFPENRKKHLSALLMAKEIIGGRANWVQNTNQELEDWNKLFNFTGDKTALRQLLKSAEVLAIADIIAHRGETKWLDGIVTNTEVTGKSRKELILAVSEAIHDVAPIQRLPENQSFASFFSDIYQTMEGNCKKAQQTGL
jgi:hypothetical protein